MFYVLLAELRLQYEVDTLTVLTFLHFDLQAFAPFKPARSAVEVARLPRDVGVEIECIAVVKS